MSVTRTVQLQREARACLCVLRTSAMFPSFVENNWDSRRYSLSGFATLKHCTEYRSASVTVPCCFYTICVGAIYPPFACGMKCTSKIVIWRRRHNYRARLFLVWTSLEDHSGHLLPGMCLSLLAFFSDSLLLFFKCFCEIAATTRFYSLFASFSETAVSRGSLTSRHIV